jgi:hypothetical protein
MAKYSPFAEKTGMKKVTEQKSTESVNEMNHIIIRFGFDLRLLGSERYVAAKIESLTEAQINTLKLLF